MGRMTLILTKEKKSRKEKRDALGKELMLRKSSRMKGEGALLPMSRVLPAGEHLNPSDLCDSHFTCMMLKWFLKRSPS